ncbi:MAG: glycosyltransferase family 4 protein, partial [Nanoarchaeota archaeon]|nr:glycosyltransferase family 4 protein [Nanoarchaeota archaeon]
FPIFPSYAASFFKRSKLVITWHEVWDEYWETQGFARFPGWTIERMCARLSSRNIAVSDMTASRLARIGGKGIHIIPNWVDLETIDKAKPAKRRYDIISTGRHLKSKNFDRLLTVSALLKKTKKDFSALILGEGPGTYELLRLRRKLGLEDCVDILSFCPEKEGLYSYMKASSVFVLLSGLEGFSLSAMEAMACSLPILTTNGERNALKELVKGNGFVCRESEVEIASRLSQLLSDSKMREKMGKASRKIAEAHNPENAMRKILKVYSS